MGAVEGLYFTIILEFYGHAAINTAAITGVKYVCAGGARIRNSAEGCDVFFIEQVSGIKKQADILVDVISGFRIHDDRCVGF